MTQQHARIITWTGYVETQSNVSADRVVEELLKQRTSGTHVILQARNEQGKVVASGRYGRVLGGNKRDVERFLDRAIHRCRPPVTVGTWHVEIVSVDKVPREDFLAKRGAP